MFNISKTERFFILILLVSGLFYTGLSYCTKKSSRAEIGTFNMSVREIMININTAGPDELEKLPGIGPVLAADIVSYRDSIRRFEDTEDLMEVKGIGRKKFEHIKHLITTGE